MSDYMSDKLAFEIKGTVNYYDNIKNVIKAELELICAKYDLDLEEQE